MNHSKQLQSIISELKFPKVIPVFADGETPTANNPSEFISISNNGPASTELSNYMLIRQVLSISIYVKLLSTGAKNTKLEDDIYSVIFNAFKNTIKSEQYTFQVSKLNMFGNYKNLTAGYSTKIINIDSNYINN